MKPDEQIVEINGAFVRENRDKFMAGQREHGGDFFQKPTVENIREEAIDLVNYVHVLRKHKEELLEMVEAMQRDFVLSPSVAERVIDIKRKVRTL